MFDWEEKIFIHKAFSIHFRNVQSKKYFKIKPPRYFT